MQVLKISFYYSRNASLRFAYYVSIKNQPPPSYYQCNELYLIRHPFRPCSLFIHWNFHTLISVFGFFLKKVFLKMCQWLPLRGHKIIISKKNINIKLGSFLRLLMYLQKFMMVWSVALRKNRPNYLVEWRMKKEFSITFQNHTTHQQPPHN